MKFEFEVIETADKSPTLRLLAGDQKEAQCMHHLGGALSESEYIYLEATKVALKQRRKPHVLSVGLGLGYNELLTLAEISTSHPELIDKTSLVSYESEKTLCENLRSYILNQPLPENWSALYASIFKQISSRFDMKEDSLVSVAKNLLTSQKWQMRSALTLVSLPKDERFSVIYFDAFSSSASPNLWTEEFLNDFLLSCSEELSIFVTYAVTGALKRSFKKNHFEVFHRSGFKGKRESTWAVKKDLDGSYLSFRPPSTL